VKPASLLQHELMADVRYGSLADIEAHPRHVRFAPKSEHSLSALGCLLCAKSGHCITNAIASSAHGSPTA
jgi:hypothetical protein